MIRPTPNHNEITLSHDEMFFSITDHRGIILDGNDVFRRISRYSREELIGSPHSIIRHPDMPKIVFKTLWQTILNGKPICAYVKNLAKDGSYYWVFATVIPIGDKFLSVRMKSTTPLMGIAEGLYKELVNIEKESGIEASANGLISALNSLGFPDYETFVLASLSAELSSRYEIQSKMNSKFTNQLHLSNVRESFFKIFNIIVKLASHTKVISEQILKIREVSKQIEYSAINATIEADRLGSDGRALAVIAQHISLDAAEAKKSNSNINLLAVTMLEMFRSGQLSAALSTLQIEMLLCFIEQWNIDQSSMTKEGVETNSEMLSSLVEEGLKIANGTIQTLANDSTLLSSELESISQILRTLDFIQKNGSIEAARLPDDSDFSLLFSTILRLLKDSKVIYSELSDLTNRVIKKEVTEAIKEYDVLSSLWSSKQPQVSEVV